MARRRLRPGNSTDGRWLWGARGARLFDTAGAEDEPAREVQRPDVVRLVRTGELPVAIHSCGEGVRWRTRGEAPDAWASVQADFEDVDGWRPPASAPAKCPTGQSCGRRWCETGRPWSFATTEQPDLLIAAGADSRSDQGCAWTHDRLRAMAVDDPWTTPSKLATSILLTVALAALGLTSWYVWPGFPYTFIGLALAGLLLGGPLVTRWPITPRRAGFSAAAWFVVGVPGSYTFGIPVILTSLVLALGVAGIVLRALLVRERSVPG